MSHSVLKSEAVPHSVLSSTVVSHSVLNIDAVSHSVRISTAAVTHSVLKIEAVPHSVLNSETVSHSVLSSTVLFHSCWPCSFLFCSCFSTVRLGVPKPRSVSAALLFLKDVDYVVRLVLLAAQESEEKLAGQILKYLSEGCINSHLILSPPRSHISRGHGTHQVADSLKKLNP